MGPPSMAQLTGERKILTFLDGGTVESLLGPSPPRESFPPVSSLDGRTRPAPVSSWRRGVPYSFATPSVSMELRERGGLA